MRGVGDIVGAGAETPPARVSGAVLTLRGARRLSLCALVAAIAVLGLGPPASAATSVAYVQGVVFGTGTQVTSTQATLTRAVGAGDLLVGWFSQYNAAGSVQVSDNVNGVWTRASASEPFGSSSGDNALYYVQNTAGSAAGLTVTVSASAATYLQGTFAEYSGMATTGVLDSGAVGKGTGTAVSTSATAPVGAGELVFSAFVTGGSPNGATPGTSQGVAYTARARTGSSSVFSQDILSAAAGSQVGSATLGASTNWYAVVATFRPAAATAPSEPTGLTATSTTSSQVALSWTAPSDNTAVTGYTVYRNGTQIGSSTTTGYTDATVAASTMYSYTVSATNSAGQSSAQSAPLSVTTPAPDAPAPPAAPTGLTPGSVTDTQVVLGWTASSSSGVTGYTVYRNGTQIGSSTTTGYTDATVAASTTYSYTISATDSAGQSSVQSAPLSVTTPAAAQPPSTPTGLTAASVTSSQVVLSWTAPSDNTAVTGYTIYRNGTQIGSATTTGYTDAGVAASTTYSYTVSATNSAGQSSAQSDPLSVTTSPTTQDPCSATGLASAISTANSTGTGTVSLTAGCTYTLSASGTAPDGPTGLPAITGTVTIDGDGATISRSTAAGTPDFRILDVAIGGRLTLRNVTLSNGIADDGVNGGGGIYNHGTLAITGVTFSSNSSPATTGTSGAAISNDGTLSVSTSTFTGGTAQEGGGVFNQATATITQSTFTNNTATIYGGGAILNAYGTTTVSGSTFIGNSGPGGGVIDNDTMINISDSTFYDNTGGTHGGGAIQNFGTVNLTTSTLSGNTSPYGANIYNYGSSQITVSSTVVADGRSGSNCGGSAVIDGGYNIDSTAACGFSAAKNSASNTAPQLQAPAANGGPTMTMALTPGSPAIDAIPASTPGCTGTTDQRGVTRPQGASCDVGAYEQLSTGSDTQPPTVPSGLAAGSTAAGAVTFGWSPSTDDVGVGGYTVYRDGTVIGTSGGSTLSYTDATAAPSTTYRYAVDAYDAAGNHSALSAELWVTTGSAAAIPPQQVQGTAATTGSKVTSLTIPLAAPVAAGDLLVGWFGQYDATGQVQVRDNVNGAWTRAPGSTTFGSGTGHGDIALYYVQNSAAAAAGGLTITVSAEAATYLQGVVAEYSGVARTGALHTSAVGKGTGTAADTATTAAVNAGELVFGGLLTGGSPGAVTAGGGLALRDHNASFSADDGDMVAVAGAQHAPWTLTSSTDWYAGVAVFHTAAGP